MSSRHEFAASIDLDATYAIVHDEMPTGGVLLHAFMTTVALAHLFDEISVAPLDEITVHPHDEISVHPQDETSARPLDEISAHHPDEISAHPLDEISAHHPDETSAHHPDETSAHPPDSARGRRPLARGQRNAPVTRTKFTIIGPASHAHPSVPSHDHRP